MHNRYRCSNLMEAQIIQSHYIPRFYQRGFIADRTGLIWVYSKDNAPRLVSVRKTGMALNLYAFRTKNNQLDSTTVEQELAKLDSEGAIVIRRLQNGYPLTDDERWTLSRFVSVMWRRTTAHKEHAEKMTSGMMRKFFEDHDENWLYELLTHRLGSGKAVEGVFDKQKSELARMKEDYQREVPSFIFPNNTLRDSIFEKVLFAMDWAYFRATTDTEFVTCDDPVVFNKGTGLKNEDAVIIFPLSRFLLLQGMWKSSYRGAFVQLADLEVRTLNRYIVSNASKEVYSSKKSNVFAEFVAKRLGAFANKTLRMSKTDSCYVNQ